MAGAGRARPATTPGGGRRDGDGGPRRRMGTLGGSGGGARRRFRVRRRWRSLAARSRRCCRPTAHHASSSWWRRFPAPRSASRAVGRRCCPDAMTRPRPIAKTRSRHGRNGRTTASGRRSRSAGVSPPHTPVRSPLTKARSGRRLRYPHPARTYAPDRRGARRTTTPDRARRTPAWRRQALTGGGERHHDTAHWCTLTTGGASALSDGAPVGRGSWLMIRLLEDSLAHGTDGTKGVSHGRALPDRRAPPGPLVHLVPSGCAGQALPITPAPPSIT